jgi:simple sugar transport system ATP-binding protein
MVIPSGTNRAVNTEAPRLALTGISRRFGNITALDGASLTVARGEVHALLGENGAGKSSLMKIAYGLDQPDAGTIDINGRRTVLHTPREAMAHGIGMVQQHFALVDAMTVAENVALGGGGRFDLAATADTIRRLSAASGLPLDPDARVSTLAVGAQQRLEIIKALARNAEVLILDEPTAVLVPAEARELLDWTRRFADAGGTVILIAHKLREILSIADRVTVLRRGTTVLTASASDVTEQLLADAMLGPTRSAATPRNMAARQVSAGTPTITLVNVAATDPSGVTRLTDATLSVNSGEIVGIAAIEGAGQHELLRVIAGRIRPTRGTVSIPEVVGFVPEDRQRDAIVLDATLTENLALRGADRRRGLMPWPSLSNTTSELLRTHDVRAEDTRAAIRTLSGGNQQKFVVGRELADTPRALVVENPTRGLDIRATAAVHSALRTARDAGTAIVVYSSDLDEVLQLSDRVLVVAAGVVRDAGSDRDAVGLAMLDAIR